MSKVKRVYVEKKQPYAVKAKELTEDIKGYLGINTLDAVRVLVRYDVENLSEDTYKKALTTVLNHRLIMFMKKIFRLTKQTEFLAWNICRDSLIRELILQNSVLSF